MYLYDNDGKFLCVYELIPKMEKIKEYKRKEIEKISEDKRLWSSLSSSVDNQIFSSDVDFISDTKLDFYTPYYNGVSSHKLVSQDYNNDIIDSYSNRVDSFGRPIKIIKRNGESKLPSYYITIKNNYDKEQDSYVMRDIIAIPESLYNLELLLSKRYDLIKDINELYEQLDLFEIKEVNRIEVKLLHAMRDYGMMPSENIDKLSPGKRKLLYMGKKKTA